VRPLLERPISFRLSDASRKRYAIAAAQRGVSLSQYLRERLEIEDQITDHVDQLRLELFDDRDNQQGVGTDHGAAPILIEMLLLARQRVTPAHLRTVHRELVRLGIQPWSPNQRTDSSQ